jgi:hypothetical protein
VGTVGRGREGLGSNGWAVDHQPRTSVDGYSHHNHQKSDLQVSQKGRLIYAMGLKVGKEGSRERDWSVCDIHERAVQYVSLHMCARI